MNLRVYLQLGRVSNLPTVWTNVFAGIALGGGTASPIAMAVLLPAASLAYTGGMFLNDAFDRDIDARQRPERPIPSGQIAATRVFAIGFALLAACVLLVEWLVLALEPHRHLGAIVSATCLTALIVLYDAWHKQNSFSALIMGCCRGAVYVTAALATGGAFTVSLVIGALSLVAYVVGLTLVARQETQSSFEGRAALALLFAPVAIAVYGGADSWSVWSALALFVGWVAVTVRPLLTQRGPGVVPRAVVRMIAGICLLDGMLGAAYASWTFALAGAGGLLSTLALQRLVRGT
jgi:hypothetical protein